MKTVSINGTEHAPSKIVCIGRNYVAHIEELGNEVPEEMVVFNKPNSALGATLCSNLGEALHYEGELAFAVNKGEFHAVAFGLDLTKRTLQSSLKAKGLPWERAKAFDGAALFSGFVPLPDDIDSLSLALEVDGLPRQAGGIDLMMYKPATILRELKKFMSLEDGDIVMTGTPAGVGQVMTGELFEGKVFADDQELVSVSWLAA